MYYRNNFRKSLGIAVLCALLVSSTMLAGCTTSGNDESSGQSSGASKEVKDSSKDNKNENSDSGNGDSSVSGESAENDLSEAVAITLSGSTASSAKSEGVEISGSTITISEAGTYVLSGSLDDGNIVIDAGKDDSVRLVLDNATIKSSSTAAICAVKSGGVILQLQKDTVNTLSDGSSYVSESTDSEAESDSDSPNAAVYVKDDLTIVGSGTLNVTGNANNGITSKDVLAVNEGTVNVSAAHHGLTGKDELQINGGTINVETTSGDGLRSTNSDEEDTGTGNVFVNGGTVTVNSANDGIQAEKALSVTGGSLNITTGGGSASGKQSSEESRKGLKSGSDITISGGEITIDSADDGVHADNNFTVTDGTVTVKTGDDGIHADAELTVEKGTVTVSESYEGFEAEVVEIKGGTVDITSSDDGINCAGGDDSSGFGGMDGDMQFGTRGGMNDVSDTANLKISGGMLSVNAQGDGLDSNGNMDITGGTIIVNGTTQGGNGIIDHGGTMNMNGGVLIGAGTSDMLEMPDSSSQQKTLVVLFDGSKSAETLVYVADSSGKTIAAMKPKKSFGCFILSCEELKSGEKYSVYLGGEADGVSINGYYSGGSAAGGTLYSEFTLSDDAVTYVNSSGVTTYTGGMGPGNMSAMLGGRGGHGGFDRGTMPEGSVPDGSMPTPPTQDGNMPTPPTQDGNMPTPPA